MAKNLYEEKRIIKIVGRLNKNENGEFTCTVENNYGIQEYNIIELLEQMDGTEISLQSTNEIA